jgi:hypothetical protein
MTIVHIEHPVIDYDRWKATFDSDPVGRAGMGVRRYRIVRAADDPNVVMIDLEFATKAQAERMLASLQRVWGRVEGVLIKAPKGRIFEVVESSELPHG